MKIIGRIKLNKYLYVCNYLPDHPSPCLNCADTYFEMCGGTSIKQAKRVASISTYERKLMFSSKVGKRHLVLLRNQNGSIGMVAIPHIPFPSCKGCKGKGIIWRSTEKPSAMSMCQLFEGFIGQNKLVLKLDSEADGLDSSSLYGQFAALSFFSPEYKDGGHEALDYAFGSSGDTAAASKVAWYEALERIYVFANPQNEPSHENTIETTAASFSVLEPGAWEQKYCARDEFGGITRRRVGKANDKLRWYKGKDLNGQAILIPEHLLFCSTWKTNAGLYLASSGCAVHKSSKEAKLRSALEVIERDCALRSWVTGRTGYKIIDWEKYDAELTGLYDTCEKLGLFTLVRELSDVSGVSVVIALLVSKNGQWPACSIGTSAKPHQPSAVKSALYEALLNYLLQRRRGESEINLPTTFCQPTHTHPIVHNHFYGQPKNLHHISFWLTGDRTGKLDNACHLTANDEATISQYLHGTGKTFYFYGLEPEFLRRKKFYVFRCISPDVAELTFQIGAFYLPTNIDASSIRPDVFKIPHPFC